MLVLFYFASESKNHMMLLLGDGKRSFFILDFDWIENEEFREIFPFKLVLR